MIDNFTIFTKTGLVLWSKTLSKLTGNPVDIVIQTVLLEDRSGDKEFTTDLYTMKWSFDNRNDIVIVVVYQKILQLLYIEELLKKVKSIFIDNFQEQIKACTPVDFDDEFTTILREVEKTTLMKKVTKNMQTTFKSTDKDKKPKISASGPTEIESTETSDTSASNVDEFEELKKMQALKTSGRTMRTGPGRKSKSKTNTSGDDDKKKKKMTKWQDGKLSRGELQALDHSKDDGEDDGSQIKDLRQAYIGEDEGGIDEEEEWSDDEQESDASRASEDESDASSASESGTRWSFKSSRIGRFLHSISGNKILEREDLEEIVAGLKQQLISKNVASEVAEQLSESVISTLIGNRLESFTRVNTIVRKSLEEALRRILTPKKSTDILREIMECNASGKLYSIVFVGVNGVGKSTSLSKVAYYLKSKGIKIMLAACDTFRSGAVEQLNQHAKVLDVPLFQRGYAKDPASVARDAIAHAKSNGYECVLIDTAGRMQNNEPLMRALANLVSLNDPNLVLFVGEALVGNDGVDQVELFDRALADYSDKQSPHRIDGILLTKFDTIDDKVGAAVSMVYKTGQPVMFVGTGQKYTNLKKLNVRTVLKNLMD